ncbi:MAG TPA: cation:proton antiporter [Polyangiaceae bacterium]
MTDHDVAVFLLVLAAARLLGELARASAVPVVVGEILAGILLGPTVLGRAAPGWETWLSPLPTAPALTGGLTTMAVVLLVLVAGVDVDPGVLRRRRRAALVTGLFGVALPAASCFALGVLLPASDLVDPSRRVAAAALLAFALSVSAVPVIAQKLVDLGLFKSDVGLLVTAAATVDDAVLVLALGAAAAANVLPWPAVAVGATVGAAFVAASRSHPRIRKLVEAFVVNAFAPIFFASVGLRIDFVGAFDLRLCLLVLGIAAGAKVFGAALGARLGGMRWREATAVGVGMNARGAAGIALAAVAREAGLVGDPTVVALVLTAVVTSLAGGPTMKWLLYKHEAEEDVVKLLRRGAFVSELKAATPADAIHELTRALGSLLTGMKRDARDAVIERELVAATGLGDEVAIPHAAVEGLARPLLALGLAPQGIDFDAPDGRPARIVFLLLIPPRAYEEEVHILASIARATFGARARTELLAASSLDEVTRVLAKSARRTKESMRPPGRGS